MQRVDGDPRHRRSPIYTSTWLRFPQATEKRVRIGDPITVNQNFRDSAQGHRRSPRLRQPHRHLVGRRSIATPASSKRNSTPKSARSPTPWRKWPIRRTSDRLFAQTRFGPVVDVTHATDYPGINKQTHGDIRMGTARRSPTAFAITLKWSNAWNKSPRRRRFRYSTKPSAPPAARIPTQFLDPRWHSQCPDQPAESLHAFAGRSS